MLLPDRLAVAPLGRVPSGRIKSHSSPSGQVLESYWVRIVRAEVTDQMLIIGPRHLRVVLDASVAHYKRHRSHRPGPAATRRS